MTNFNLMIRARKRLNITLEKLSELSEIDLKVLKAIEAGHTNLTKEQAKVLSPILEILPEELLNKEDTEDSSEMKLEKTRIIAIATNKGGAGKTSITQNLAYALALKNYKILLIDTDGQMNLSQCFDIEPNEDNNIFKSLVNKESLTKYILHTVYPNIDFIAGDERMKDIEGLMTNMKFSEKRMSAVLNEVVASKTYDFIFIDTPPSLGKLNTSVLCSCTDLIIPLEASIFGVNGTVNMIRYYNEIKEEYESLNLLGLLMNNINKSTSIQNDVREAVKSYFPENLLTTEISQDINIKKSQMESRPVQDFNPKCKSATDFSNLAQEVLSIVRRTN